MLTGRIDKFNHESTIQREVKLDTGEFDPPPSTHRHFLLKLAAVRDDGFRAREQNKKRREKCLKMVGGGGVSVKT